MKALYDLKEKFCTELEDIARKPEMSSGDLETIHKLTDTIKNINKICMQEDNQYSQNGNYSQNSYGGGWEMEGRGSYGRGSSYRRRDNMGRYSSSARMYSRADAKEAMMGEAQEMMEMATTEKEREAIRRLMEELGRN